ncbi:MAG: hypothetical protein WCT39_05135, partial [Candidatus Margulisiibacteriota bacterium]
MEQELARMRSRNKVLKAATIVLTTLFLLVGGAVVFIYHKVSGIRDMLLPPTETFQDPAFAMGEERPAPGEQHMVFSTQPAAGSALTVFTNAGEFSQEQTDDKMVSDAAGAKAANALMKYADRQIVKDFIAAAKEDPAFAAALKKSDPANPLSVFSSIQNVKSVQNLAMRFVLRKDFLPLLMEVTNDPDVKPLLGKMPMGNLGNMTRMLQSIQGGGASQYRPKAPSGRRPAEQVPVEDNPGN